MCNKKLDVKVDQKDLVDDFNIHDVISSVGLDFDCGSAVIEIIESRKNGSKSLVKAMQRIAHCLEYNYQHEADEWEDIVSINTGDQNIDNIPKDL